MQGRGQCRGEGAGHGKPFHHPLTPQLLLDMVPADGNMQVLQATFLASIISRPEAPRGSWSLVLVPGSLRSVGVLFTPA